MHRYLSLVFSCVIISLILQHNTYNCSLSNLTRLPPRANLHMASEQGSLWLIESSLKYNIISYKIIHELVLYITLKKKNATTNSTN